MVGYALATLGIAFVVVGTIMLLHPDWTIRCNGRLTTAWGCKAIFTALGAVQVVAGLVLLFARRRIMLRPSDGAADV